jgi:ABC-type multidrug transport system ATPase subunit
MGQPDIVFLDEPSCGMDPVARRQMWTVMESASERCAIVLTTHSMEEAESVSTRLGIMSKGRMICLGSAQELREKYSNGLEVFVQVTGGQVDSSFMSQLIESRQSFIRVASDHSDKRKTRFLTSGMSLIGKGVNDETPDIVIVPAFAEWWAQENIFDSIEADVMGKLKTVSAFEASGRSVRFVVSPDSKIVDFDLVKAVFGLLAGLKAKGIVTDYSLTLNSLDQVFRSIASKEQEAEVLELHNN